MTQPRSRLVSVVDTPYYHCIGRCVRRAFLCGIDASSGRNYEHRRQWLLERLKQLTQIFAIDVCSYAVMSNHYHVVVKLSPSSANDWTDKVIIERWSSLYRGNEHTRAYLSGEALSLSSRAYINTHLPIWKERLSSLSWFMKCLNEYIARRANAEDQCTGHFWEGRFKSQALLDEAALISCMAYVDLNPIRAKMATTPKQSDYTSIQERIRQLLPVRQIPAKQTTQENPGEKQGWLLPMAGQHNCPESIPLDLDNYLALLDWTGSARLQNKQGLIPKKIAPRLHRLEIDQKSWLRSQHHFGKQYYLAISMLILMVIMLLLS
ncbi:MAG: transposase [Gammaproteobacteria bacterium]|nr:transposase [Gammaproteobacteria bacterium]